MMARVSKEAKKVPSIWRYNSLNLIMFGYVQGVRRTLHTVTIDDALRSFIDDYELDPDDYNIEAAKTCFNNMQNHLVDAKRNTI